MFTQKCFIKKNTKELRIKLDKLGYENIIEGEKFENECLVVSSYIREYEDDPHKGETAYVYDIVEESNIVEGKTGNFISDGIDIGINCGVNGDLFLSIAALRDDSDYMQWFVSKGWKSVAYGIYEKWVLCDKDTLEQFGLDNNSKNTYDRKNFPEFGWKKANVEELIEKFT